MQKIILASTSPRRRDLLNKIGLRFSIAHNNYKEVIPKNVTPQKAAMLISQGKAKAVAEKYPNAVIIAADTIVVLGTIILGKPHTVSKAKKMLRILSGRSHNVITGFTILDTRTNKMISQSVATKIYFRKLKPKDIAFYVKNENTLDKAGAYAIQGLGYLLIRKIEGDYFNVIGLPFQALIKTLKKFGIVVY